MKVGTELIPSGSPHRLTVEDKLDAIMQKLIEIDISITKLESTLTSTFKDEFSSDRHEVSRRLGDKVLQRLKGEFLAREATAPSGNYWCERCNQPHPKGFICR